MPNRSSVTLSWCAALMASIAAPPAIADESWSFATGVDYTAGSYGQSADTTIIEAPFTGSYERDRWGVSITVPYVSVEGPGGIAPGGLGPAGGGIVGGLLRSGNVSDAAVSGPVNAQGLGDVVIAASATPLRTQAGSSVSLSARVRTPTGDATRSLGIGETALGVNATARRLFANRAGIYGAIGYERAMESEADGLFAAAGVEGYVTTHLLAGARVDWSEAGAELRRDSQQASLYAGVDVNEDVRILVYGGAGLTDTSPDASSGLALVLRR